MENGKKKLSKKGKYILVGTGAGLIGLSLLGLWWFKWRKGTDIKDPENDLFKKLSKKTDKEEVDTEEKSPVQNTPAPTHTTSASNSSSTKSGFPLQEHSKGALVKQLQQALIKTYGKKILPKFGADGGFGTEMIAALESKGFPTVIDKDTFDKIIAGEPSSSESSTASANSNVPSIAKLPVKTAVDIAKNIWLNNTLKKLDGMVTQLKRIRNIADYTTVNTLFKTIRTNGVRQTIVNAALSPFSSDDTSKRMIDDQLERIGLKYDGDKWTLSGFQGKQLITNQKTIISSLEGIELEIPEQTLLGEEISIAGATTTFRTIDNQMLYVPTKHISYL